MDCKISSENNLPEISCYSNEISKFSEISIEFQNIQRDYSKS